MRAPSGDQMRDRVRDRVRPVRDRVRLQLRMRDRVRSLTELCRNIWRSKKLVVYLTIIKKQQHMYSLRCSYYTKKFNSIYELLDAIIADGMDPNYWVLKDGKSIGTKAIDLIQI